TDAHHVETLAEVGVAMLLFMIGLEFSLARLKEIGRAFLVAGPLQVIGTIAVTAGAILLLPYGAKPGPAVFAGMLMALSSTAMVLRLLAERGEAFSPQGRLILGILLFQDIAMVPMLVLIPALAGNGSLAVGPSLLVGLAGAIAVGLLARILMPRIVNAVIRSGVRELYVMMAVAVCLGASLLTSSLGLSPALGAFLGGLLVSESEYAHQIVAEVLPFRDLFSALFFISIGMLLLPQFLLAHLPMAVLALLFAITVKALVAGTVVRLLGFPLRIAVVVGISLAQVGEFSFVLASVGTEQGLLPELETQVFLAVAVLSLMLTPFLMQVAAWAGAHTGTRIQLPGPDSALQGHDSAVAIKRPDPSGLSGHVVIAGYGVNGRNVARVLRELGIPYVVIELDTAIIRRAQAQGEPIQFGDVSRPEGLAACRVDRASVVVLAISDRGATRFAVVQARRSNPGAYIIARTRQVAEVAELMRIGADEVIPEEFETSIAILARVLRRYHVPANVVRLQEQALRREGYSFLRGGEIAGSLGESVSRMIAGATTDTFYLEPGSSAVGLSLAKLDLRGRTLATIIAVVREGKHHVTPDADFVLQQGDILVLVGDHDALEKAYEVMSPPRPGADGDRKRDAT
ncbi:MAG TPA: cation:proton antiporter, partial [Candidatus Dormibacteraeota bacterium]|nr:cation:proton antiporter [Candidatus Dormibacteraeota bacterium]